MNGLLTEDGAEFQPSPAWVLFRAEEAPVELDDDGERVTSNRTPLDSTAIVDLALLRDKWEDAQPWLRFVDDWLQRPRSDVPLAWEFKLHNATLGMDFTVGPSGQ